MTVGHAEFGENGCDMVARGSLADHEDVGDLLVRVPVCEQASDLLFSDGEAEGIALSRATLMPTTTKVAGVFDRNVRPEGLQLAYRSCSDPGGARVHRGDGSLVRTAPAPPFGGRGVPRLIHP
jgi:hypothetical protein